MQQHQLPSSTAFNIQYLTRTLNQACGILPMSVPSLYIIPDWKQNPAPLSIALRPHVICILHQATPALEPQSLQSLKTRFEGPVDFSNKLAEDSIHGYG